MDIIEQAADFDFASIMDLINAEWPVQFGSSSEEERLAEYRKSSDPRTDVVKLLVDDGKALGWYRYSRWPRDDDNKTDAHTFDIGLLPEYRGKGYGRILMEDMIADCRNRGFRNLKSRTYLNNEASIGLHRKTGFREWMRTDDSIVWELDL